MQTEYEYKYLELLIIKSGYVRFEWLYLMIICVDIKKSYCKVKNRELRHTKKNS